ncbi:MAG: transcriptional regulator [Pseudomonadota bacterium]
MSSPFDLTHVDNIVHARVRLAVLTFLASVDGADFNAIRAATKTTEGNLSVHLQKLHEAGYVKVTKSFLDRRPNTRAEITDTGRDALIAYIDAVEAAFEKVRNAFRG